MTVTTSPICTGFAGRYARALFTSTANMNWSMQMRPTWRQRAPFTMTSMLFESVRARPSAYPMGTVATCMFCLGTRQVRP